VGISPYRLSVFSALLLSVGKSGQRPRPGPAPCTARGGSRRGPGNRGRTSPRDRCSGTPLGLHHPPPPGGGTDPRHRSTEAPGIRRWSPGPAHPPAGWRSWPGAPTSAPHPVRTRTTNGKNSTALRANRSGPRFNSPPAPPALSGALPPWVVARDRPQTRDQEANCSIRRPAPVAPEPHKNAPAPAAPGVVLRCRSRT